MVGQLHISRRRCSLLQGQHTACVYVHSSNGTIGKLYRLDIYSASPEGLDENLLQEIISKTKEVGGTVSELAGKFFPIPVKAKE